MTSKVFTAQEVGQHNKSGDAWFVIDNKVYDLSKFQELHPGGRKVLVDNAGKEVTRQYKAYHPPSVMKKYHSKLYIGDLKEGEPGYKPPPFQIPGTFGDLIPFGDPLWYQRFNSPYYKETHIQWRAKVRDFVENEIMPTLDSWKDKPVPPKDLLLKLGEAGILAALTGAPWPTEYLPAHIKGPENFDAFHELITIDELSRIGNSGALAALTNGPSIALTVVYKFGSEEMKRRIVPEVLLGQKMIALAISEPQAGSDVAGMVTTAERSSDGSHYVVNGTKKWITNGTYADYFATSFKTGSKGQLTFFLIEKDMEGFETRKLNIRGSDISGTAFLNFDNVKVPTANMIGKEGKGFKLVMYNFNHERFYVTAIVARMSRVCIEECVRYALVRTAFGKTLSEIQTIRMKIAAMVRQVESLQSWLENITYQLCTMSHEEANMKLGDVISLIKAHSSKVYEYCARESTQIFGGNALYYDGVGKKIEPAVGQVKGYQIPAGAEDVMDDFAARVAFKTAAKIAKL